MGRIFLAFLMWVAAAQAMAVDVVKPFKAESDLIRYAYHYEILDEALKRTEAKYGPYDMRPYTESISVVRGHYEGVKGELINVVISDAGQKILEEGMIPIPYPLDKGLLGFRISLILKQNQEKISKVSNVAQLRGLKIGQGRDWGDVKIYEYNRIPIERSAAYDSLFAMLVHGRFDLFPRGATEAAQELAAYGPQYPDLAIDRHLLIKYPFAQFFYVSKSAPRLAARLKDGLEQMRRDGSFDAVFNKHFAKPLAALKLKDRMIIELENPYMPSWVPLERKELWFDPRQAG